MTCPFCNLDVARIFHEGDLVVAFWDSFPVSDGHALIAPKRHVASWFDATPDERAELTATIDLAREKILTEHSPHGFNIGVNVGEAAGQTVPHLHVHVIPRYRGDVSDPRGGVRHVIPDRGNYLTRPPHARPLVTGSDLDPLLPHLLAHLDEARRVDIAVAFLLLGGVNRIIEHVRDLLERGGRFRLVTGDYLDVTEPAALRAILDLGGEPKGTLDLRVFETAETDTSFHPKAYVFHTDRATAYVGSSNLSRTALEKGVEWNYRIVEPEGVRDVARGFEQLLDHPAVRQVDEVWVDAYQKRREPPKRLARVVEFCTDDEPPEPPPEPHGIQKEALLAAEASRAAGSSAGLVVLATGLGKTWFSAFDSNRPEYRRILFVAHREEILSQAMKTYRRIRPDARLGRFTGKEKAPDADVLFASIQTLGRAAHLSKFDRDRFDYIVVDEFHHAAARTYRRVIDYFDPKFLLGLTATPERTDGGDLLALCDENLIYRCNLTEGIRQGLLCPFHYFGVPDNVSYKNIPWRSTRFDEEALTKAVATQERAENALDQYRKRAGSRTLAFCVSKRHASFMADFFNRAVPPVRAVAVHSGEESAPRAASLERLEQGDLDVVCVVDMFNEGVDVPNIDTVMMLRPTESRILWLQQLGRGLRTAEGKSHLDVIDYIGNHRTFLLKPQALFGLDAGDEAIERILNRLEGGPLTDLPPGCEVTYDLEAVDILRSLLRIPKRENALKAYYEQFRERHGVRPTATGAFHDGYNPRAAKTRYGSWIRFVASMGDLDEAALQAVKEAGDFLDVLHVTPMTRSYKMVLLRAVLNEEAFPGRIEIDRLTAAFAKAARRSQHLRADISADLDDPVALRKLIEQNPINAWVGARNAARRPYFEYEDGTFRTNVTVTRPAAEPLAELVREVVDWRLADYLQSRARAELTDGALLKVFQARGRPILELDRDRYPDLPTGITTVIADGNEYEASFVKMAVNVMKRPGSTQNELPTVLRTWFGADAGQPGTRYYTVCEKTDHGYELRPHGITWEPRKLELWQSYAREEIPALFGKQFNRTVWRQGVVRVDGAFLLIVTLEKGTMTKDHHYADRFLSPTLFEWQSQNRMERSTGTGKAIGEHERNGTAMHLFVRRRAKGDDGAAVPFTYCGEVKLVDWKGDKPITVRWRLAESIPARLHTGLRVPDANEATQPLE